MSQEGKFKQFEEQLEFDRDIIGKVRDFMVGLHDKVIKLEKADDARSKNTLSMEKAIMDKIEANKQFALNDVNSKINDLKERFKFEMSNEECFTAHLIGKNPDNKPVLRPLIDLYMKDKLGGVEQKFIILNGFMQERVQRDNSVHDYLQRVEREKPEDGNFITVAFMGVATELIEIRAATMQSQNGAGQDVTPPGLQGASAKAGPAMGAQADLLKLREDLDKLQVGMTAMAQQVQGKCHCIHVDQVGNKMLVVDRQLEVHTKAIGVMEKSIEMIRAAQSAYGSGSTSTGPPPPPAAVGGTSAKEAHVASVGNLPPHMHGQ